MYDVLSICRYIIHYSNDLEYGISNLKLQKLLYFIQAYFLITENGEPCFREDIEAWAFGPVVPKAYHKYKIYGSSLIPTADFQPDYNDNIRQSDQERINQIVEQFKYYSASDLVTITHAQAPWKNAYKENGRNNIISIESIRSYFNGETTQD